MNVSTSASNSLFPKELGLYATMSATTLAGGIGSTASVLYVGALAIRANKYTSITFTPHRSISAAIAVNGFFGYVNQLLIQAILLGWTSDSDFAKLTYGWSAFSFSVGFLLELINAIQRVSRFEEGGWRLRQVWSRIGLGILLVLTLFVGACAAAWTVTNDVVVVSNDDGVRFLFKDQEAETRIHRVACGYSTSLTLLQTLILSRLLVKLWRRARGSRRRSHRRELQTVGLILSATTAMNAVSVFVQVVRSNNPEEGQRFSILYLLSTCLAFSFDTTLLVTLSSNVRDMISESWWPTRYRNTLRRRQQIGQFAHPLQSLSLNSNIARIEEAEESFL